MSTVVTQHLSSGPRPGPGFPRYLERARAVPALALLVIFVLARGHRALEDRDEGE